MKYCNNCGKELNDEVMFCPGCGASQQAAPQQPQYQQPQYQQPQYQPAAPVDTGSIGWAILGFFIPLVGLILFLVWKDQKPLSSKKAGLGALIGVIATVVFYVIYFVIIMAFAGSYMYY